MVIILIGGGLVGFTMNNQDQAVSTIMDRLKQDNVPVTGITISNRVPLSINITLQSKSDTADLSPDDSWSIILAGREASLAYRAGIKVSSYTISVLNTKGEVITSWDSFLDSSMSSQNRPPVSPSKLDNQKVVELFLGSVNTGKLAVKRFDVFTNKLISNNGQIVEIELTAPDLDAANQSWPSFFDSFRASKANMNLKMGASIILYHIVLSDEQGNILLTYASDSEGGSGDQWYQVKGFTMDWFPHPEASHTPTLVGAQAVSTPTFVPTPTSSTSDSYPPPATATLHPYP
jgi:hypothetical protein